MDIEDDQTLNFFASFMGKVDNFLLSSLRWKIYYDCNSIVAFCGVYSTGFNI